MTLRKDGHFVGGEALQTARNAATLRWQNGKVSITDGPYAETKEQLGREFPSSEALLAIGARCSRRVRQVSPVSIFGSADDYLVERIQWNVIPITDER